MSCIVCCILPVASHLSGHSSTCDLAAREEHVTQLEDAHTHVLSSSLSFSLSRSTSLSLSLSVPPFLSTRSHAHTSMLCSFYTQKVEVVSLSLFPCHSLALSLSLHIHTHTHAHSLLYTKGGGRSRVGLVLYLQAHARTFSITHKRWRSCWSGSGIGEGTERDHGVHLCAQTRARLACLQQRPDQCE